MRRILRREEMRFGSRVQPGGDIHARQATFRAAAASRTEEDVLQSSSRLRCPVIPLDGMLPTEENLNNILNRLR